MFIHLRYSVCTLVTCFYLLIYAVDQFSFWTNTNRYERGWNTAENYCVSRIRNFENSVELLVRCMKLKKSLEKSLELFTYVERVVRESTGLRNKLLFYKQQWFRKYYRMKSCFWQSLCKPHHFTNILLHRGKTTSFDLQANSTLPNKYVKMLIFIPWIKMMMYRDSYVSKI